MIHVALSEDDSPIYRYGFIYYHMSRETNRLIGSEGNAAMALAMESEMMAAELVYATLGGNMEMQFRGLR